MTKNHSRRPFYVGLLITALLVALDQWSKAAIYPWVHAGDHAGLVTDIHGHTRYLVFGEWGSLMTSCNLGAAFGKFDDFPSVLVGGRILAVLFLTIMLHTVEASRRAVYGAMVLVYAGAIGNLVDNLWTGCGAAARPYGVRDFVNVWFEPLVGWDYHFPNFNVADACISIGAVIWVGSGFFHHAEEPKAIQAGDEDHSTDPRSDVPDAPTTRECPVAEGRSGEREDSSPGSS